MNLIIKEDNVDDKIIEIDKNLLEDFDLFKQTIISKISTENIKEEVEIYYSNALIESCLDLRKLENNCEIKIVQKKNNLFNTDGINNLFNSKESMESIFSIMKNPNMQKILSNPELINSLISFQSNTNKDLSELVSVIDTSDIQD